MKKLTLFFMFCVFSALAMAQWVTDNNTFDKNGFLASEPFTGYEGGASIRGQLDYRIFFRSGSTDKKVRKPLIIIDGFDPGDKRQIQRKDYPADGDGAYVAGEDRSIEEMMTYGPDNNGDGFGDYGLIPKLRSSEYGYDVIIVNFPTYSYNGEEVDGGADYIERNAYTIVELIQTINGDLSSNGSNEELVIVGPSMGGQISRYALAWMEKQGKDHNTRLWVSIDSPHLGANIPVGLQSMVYYLAAVADEPEAEDFYNNQLKSIAAQQQLIEQHQSSNNHAHLNNGNPIRQQYISNLTSNGLTGSGGYPQNLRKIAIVNGSIVGTPVHEEGPGEENLRIHGFFYLPFTTVKTKVMEIVTSYMPEYGESQRVSYWQRAVNDTYSTTYTNNNSNGSMDVVPGGIFNSEDQLFKSIISNRFNVIKYITNGWLEKRVNKEVHSFIPTVSALGMKNPNFHWSNSLNRNLLYNDEIPFDTYFGPQDNEIHTSFTEASVNWMLEELKGVHQDPTVYLTADDLIGSADELCNSNTRYFFFLPTKAPGDVLTWSTSSNLQITSSNKTGVTVKSLAPASGGEWGYIKATFQNTSVEKPIWVGPPSDENKSLIKHIGPYCINAIIHNSFPSVEAADSYEITTSGGIEFYNINGTQFDFMGTRTGTYIVYMKAVNSCGVIDAGKIYVEFDNSCDDNTPIIIGRVSNSNEGEESQNEVTMYPNPVDNELNVDLRSIFIEDETISLKIVNLEGKVLYEEIASQEKIRVINTSQLADGVYNLIVSGADQSFTEKLIIEH